MPKVCAMGTGNGFMETQVFPEMQKSIDNDIEMAEQGYDLSKSGDTQVPNTIATYRKVMDKHFKGVKGSDILDYGAGLGIATKEFGFDSFEPYAKKGFVPTYTSPNQIVNEYKGVISNAVLNVLPMAERVEAVQTIGKSLEVGGKAVILTRKDTDLNSLVNPIPYQDGVISKGKGTFQKGFTHAEIENFVKSILGTGFSVVRTAGSNALLITRLR
jgi:hypothetical protein